MDFLSYTFMQNALLASLLVSLAAGCMGALIVANRLVFISGGIAHSAYGGVGLAYYLGLAPLWGALGFTLPLTVLIGILREKYKESTDILIGVIWSGGMALGVIFLDLTPGYKADLMSFLFGNILSVSSFELWMMLGLAGLIILLLSFFFKQVFSVSVDPEYAATRGLPVRIIRVLILLMIALSVILMMRATGLILMIALLTVPAAIGKKWVFRLHHLMLVSMLLSLVFCLGGLFLSWVLNVSSGASIILFACLVYFANMALPARKGVHS